MTKRRASTQCRIAGAIGRLDIRDTERYKKHPADGAEVRVLTNRFSGILVELTKSHGPYSKGTMLSVRPGEILFGKMAILKEMLDKPI